MSEIKIYRIEGIISKPNLKTKFSKEVRAIKPEDAIEIVLSEIGSKHRVKRFQIKILDVKEISPEEARNPIIRKISLGEV